MQLPHQSLHLQCRRGRDFLLPLKTLFPPLLNFLVCRFVLPSPFSKCELAYVAISQLTVKWLFSFFVFYYNKWLYSSSVVLTTVLEECPNCTQLSDKETKGWVRSGFGSIWGIQFHSPAATQCIQSREYFLLLVVFTSSSIIIMIGTKCADTIV